MFYVYAIWNKIRNKIYIGQSSNLKERLKRHNGLLKNKLKSYTNKNSGEWLLIHQEEFEIRKAAIIREKELKSYQGRKFIRSLINKK